jgi:mannose-1-phosphate guanylyltransferase
MRAMILAAGLGTRLRPLTDELPKPLVPVLGRPLIEHTIRLLRAAGVSEIAVNLHHLPAAIPAALGDGSALGVSLRYVVEEGRIRGTGGGVRGARHLLDDGETFLVVNGDVLLEPDLGAALALHRRLGAVATLVLREDPRAAAFGALEVDAAGRVRRLLGRPEQPAACSGPLRTAMFTGVHLLEPEVFDRLPEEGCIVRSLYRAIVDSGEVLGGYLDAGPWVELGTPQDYLDVCCALLDGSLRMRHLPLPPPGGVLVEPGAEVADPALLVPPVSVGAGARVLARTARSVVWPGALVSEPVEDAVVTPRGVVRRRRPDNGRARR